MTDKDILISNLNDISEILNSNGYGRWCEAIRKAVALFKEQDKHIYELQQLVNDGFDVTKAATKRIKEQEAIIEQYHKADTFLEAHGWRWEVGEVNESVEIKTDNG